MLCGKIKAIGTENHCQSIVEIRAYSNDYVCGNHRRVTRNAHGKAKNRRNQSSSTSALYVSFVSSSLLSVLIVSAKPICTYIYIYICVGHEQGTHAKIHVWLFMSRDLENQTIVICPPDLVNAISIVNRECANLPIQLPRFQTSFPQIFSIYNTHVYGIC